MNRPDATYRASRRNLAKAHKLVWPKLERSHEGGIARVMLPRWAWEMPKKVPVMLQSVVREQAAPFEMQP